MVGRARLIDSLYAAATPSSLPRPAVSARTRGRLTRSYSRSPNGDVRGQRSVATSGAQMATSGGVRLRVVRFGERVRSFTRSPSGSERVAGPRPKTPGSLRHTLDIRTEREARPLETPEGDQSSETSHAAGGAAR